MGALPFAGIGGAMVEAGYQTDRGGRDAPSEPSPRSYERDRCRNLLPRPHEVSADALRAAQDKNRCLPCSLSCTLIPF
jgi:hypothetical protein